jgi:hypothetical protein
MSLRPMLEEMLDHLESHKLEVQLVPLNPRLRNWSEFGMKRAVVNAPPKWFRNFCNNHVSSRGVRKGKFDTKIKRVNVLSALRRLLDGDRYKGKYREELLGIARKQRVEAGNPF